jgi:hypothetical protein
MNKKVIDIISLFLVILFFVITIWALTSCQKKQTIIEYKVDMVERPNTYACRYTLTAIGREPIIMWDICGKYKYNDVVLRVIE